MDALKLLGGLLANKSLASGIGSQILGGLLGGGQPTRSAAPSGGALGNVLGAMMGGGGGGGGGGLGALLGGLMGGGGAGGGAVASGLGGLLGGLMGGGSHAAPAPQAAPAPAAPQMDANSQAILMIRAMVNAAKSDGKIDEQEQAKIVGKLGEHVGPAEIEFLKREFAAPLDVASFARSIPRGMEPQIYGLSLTSIDLDTQNEANYLGQLAQALKLPPANCNQIHDQLGAPRIFE